MLLTSIWEKLRAQLVDSILGATFLLLTLLPYGAVRLLAASGMDIEAIRFLSDIDKWGTIAVFALFWWGLIIRAWREANRTRR